MLWERPTITVGKVSDTEEILGGYNPVSWDNHSYNYVSTIESFIFVLDKITDKNIVGFVNIHSSSHLLLF